jgi:NB-ARC domain
MSGRIPTVPPETYVSHMPGPATPFVNRAGELRLLSDWAADASAGAVLTIVGLGGIGKTALVREWFVKGAETSGHFQGRMWWSLYQEDAHRFFVECFAYLTGALNEEAEAKRPDDLAAGIVRQLDRGRYLLVLDGIERELLAYSNLPSGTGAAATSHEIRRSASVVMARFLRSCARISSPSKVLLTSRLAPADLENSDGGPTPGVQTLALGGFDENSARQYLSQVAGGFHSDELMKFAAAAQFHPLLLAVLARQVAADPKSLDQIRTALRWTDARGVRSALMPILESTIHGLGPDARAAAQRIAAFDESVGYSTLVELLVGTGKEFARESQLDQALSRLQDLGLMFWNQQENTYAMHPVIRSAVWQTVLASSADR